MWGVHGDILQGFRFRVEVGWGLGGLGFRGKKDDMQGLGLGLG